MNKLRIQLILINSFGEFVGKPADVSEQNYKGLLEMIKKFYITGGFELTLEDGTFVVFPPQITEKSILKVVKLERNVQE
jgi:hypothetical protein